MVFGAYKLEVTNTGVECDSWLPVVGNPYTLNDIARLKTMFDACMLRVFEGVGKALTLGRDARQGISGTRIRMNSSTPAIPARSVSPSSVSDSSDVDEDDGKEHEDDDEEADEPAARQVLPLDLDEIRELELLTTDMVKILDAYAIEREGERKIYTSSSSDGGDDDDFY